MNRTIRKVAFLAVAAFVIVIVYLTYLSLWQGERLASHPLNQRQARQEQMIDRGGIFDSQGEQIAETTWQDSTPRRYYPRGRAFAHLVGYNSQKYGKSGLEAAYNGQLLGQTGAKRLQNMIARLSGRLPVGLNLHLTVDSRLQELAVDLLGNRRGSVVAIEPETGRILAMASSPSFNPNLIDQEFSGLSLNPDGVFLNRALQGLYPPGSTMKLATASVALTQQKVSSLGTVSCPGYLVVQGRRLGDTGAHGEVDFTRAVSLSCNTYFGRLGLALGGQAFNQGAEEFGFNRKTPFELSVTKSVFPTARQLTANGLAEAAIGQGRVLATPLQMALVTAAVANDGIMMKPYLVQALTDKEGRTVDETKPSILFQPMDADTARQVRAAMAEAVRTGTGKAAAISGITVAGKTGSAENPQGKTHAWFVALAPADQPQVAVAVIVENSGYGGSVAAPIAREIIRETLRW